MLQDNVDVIKDGKEKLVKKLNVEKIQEKLMEVVNVWKVGLINLIKETYKMMGMIGFLIYNKIIMIRNKEKLIKNYFRWSNKMTDLFVIKE